MHFKALIYHYAILLASQNDLTGAFDPHDHLESIPGHVLALKTAFKS